MFCYLSFQSFIMVALPTYTLVYILYYVFYVLEDIVDVVIIEFGTAPCIALSFY